jgi:phage regulator Rha-like protein
MPKLAVAQEVIEQKIYVIRGQKVMLSTDLSNLYGVLPGSLTRQVRRNKDRFPDDFMFKLTKKEYLKCQNGISSWGGLRRAMPYAFTEHGILMLSSVLRSQRATQVNIAIMRAFVKLRQILSANKELAGKLKELEQRIEKHDTEIHAIFEAIRQLMTPLDKPKRRIGFHSEKN